MQLCPGFLITCCGEAIRSRAQINCLTFEGCLFDSLSALCPNMSECEGHCLHQDELWTASHSITLNYNTLASVKDTHYGHVCARGGVHACTRPYRSCILMWDACFNCSCVFINVFSLATDAAFMCFLHMRDSVWANRGKGLTRLFINHMWPSLGKPS